MTTERITIKLSETAKILLKRIVKSRFGEKSVMMYDSMIERQILYDSMIEHLIWEEARRRKLTDQDLEVDE